MQLSAVDQIKVRIADVQFKRDVLEQELSDLKELLAKAKAAEPFCEAITAHFTGRIVEGKKRCRDSWKSCAARAVPGTPYCDSHHRADPKKLAKGLALKESGAPEKAHHACKECGVSRGARIDSGAFGSGLCVPCRKRRYNA
jgi:hypothetical protein